MYNKVPPANNNVYPAHASTMICDHARIAQAIHHTAHAYPGGARALARRLGVHPGTFNNKCDPAMDSHLLNLHEVAAMMRAAGDPGILETLAAGLHHACVARDGHATIGDMELLDAWANWDVERGATAAAIRHALADRRIDAAEYAGIRAEMFGDFSRALSLLERLHRLVPIHDGETPPFTDGLKGAAWATVQNYAGGLAGLADALGVRAGNLRRKCDPAITAEILNIHEACALMRITDDYAILHALAAAIDHRCVRIPRYEGMSDMALLDAWSAWHRQDGEVTAAIHDALTDGRIGADELAHIEGRMDEGFRRELALLARLDAMR